MAKIFTCAMSLGLPLLICALLGRAQQLNHSASFMAPPLKISYGDLLEVTMFDNADLSGRFRVDERGEIVISLIGRIHVEGITAGEAASAIETRYVEAQILQPAESHASVFIVEYATQGITVNGEVKAPGVYPALGIRMLNDVISAAGGVTAAASSKVIITHKNNSENATTVEYSPEAITPIIPQVQIFPGDTVMVPRAGIIYVLGAVVKAGGYVLDGRRPLTVESAMALAGGGGRAAALKRAQLVRTQSDGKKENVAVRIDLIYKGKSPDMILQDGDILYIPTSRGKLVSEQAISSALGMGTSVAVYRSSYQ
jgi:polysaccharide export outer membrane protein